MSHRKVVLIEVDPANAYPEEAGANHGDYLLWFSTSHDKFKIEFDKNNCPCDTDKYDSDYGCVAARVTARGGKKEGDPYKYTLKIGSNVIDPQVIVW